jgi:hypothetical protein
MPISVSAAPAPAPSPTFHLYVEQAGSGAGAWDWLASIAPFVVSLVALGGVVWSARQSAKNTSDAEDRRHKNQLDHDALRWRRDTTADAYFRMLAAAATLVDAVRQARWFNRDVNPGPDYHAAHEDEAEKQVDAWNAAGADLELLASTIRAIGNPEVATLGEELRACTNDALELIDEAVTKAKAGESPYVHTKVAAELLDECREIEAKLIAAVRSDLGR